jgi:hypothetical protein
MQYWTLITYQSFSPTGLMTTTTIFMCEWRVGPAWGVVFYIHESEGQNGQMALKKSRESHVNRLSSHFNAETKRNALLELILIVKTPGSRGMITQYPSVKTRYSSIPFCEVIHIYIIRWCSIHGKCCIVRGIHVSFRLKY